MGAKKKPQKSHKKATKKLDLGGFFLETRSKKRPKRPRLKNENLCN
jgi:hypothetical protein